MEEKIIPKTKHKGLKIGLGIVLIIGLLVGVYFLYQYKFNNPKTIILNVLEDARGNIKENFNKTLDNSKYKVNGTIKIDGNFGEEAKSTFDTLKNLDFSFNGEIDPKENIGNIIINTKYKNDDLLNIKAYYEKDDIYMFLQGIYDKYLKYNKQDTENKSMNDLMPNMNISSKDLETIIDALITSFKKEITKFDIKQESTTIAIDGKDRNVLNNYVILTNNEVNDLIKNIYTNLANNNEFINALKNITKEDINKETLKEYIKMFDTEGFTGSYRINVYTDKGIFNKKLVSIRQEITTYGIASSYNIDKVNDDEIIMSMASMGVSYSLKIKKTDTTFNISLSMYAMMYYFKIDLNTTYEKINEIKKPDLSNYKNADELTEEEKKEIENKMNNIKALQKLINELIPKIETTV